MVEQVRWWPLFQNIPTEYPEADYTVCDLDLHDMDTKYAGVVSLEETLAYVVPVAAVV